MTIPEALGTEIRAEAEAQRITLTELAKKAGTSRATLYNWINAERAMPIEGMLAIADVFRIPASDLLARAEARDRRTGTTTK